MQQVRKYLLNADYKSMLLHRIRDKYYPCAREKSRQGHPSRNKITWSMLEYFVDSLENQQKISERENILKWTVSAVSGGGEWVTRIQEILNSTMPLVRHPQLKLRPRNEVSMLLLEVLTKLRADFLEVYERKKIFVIQKAISDKSRFGYVDRSFYIRRSLEPRG